jgi:hypothetical protein
MLNLVGMFDMPVQWYYVALGSVGECLSGKSNLKGENTKAAGSSVDVGMGGWGWACSFSEGNDLIMNHLGSQKYLHTSNRDLPNKFLIKYIISNIV